ncbi:hypothetical protein CCM_08894 [Cordyceps militaris CM01]|uniref:Uncharacterized protein n=1 Tax=Cordyceps militaris (strain CM01) TaxID=983644 RepID=G3JSK2_CORMM|nr:uncharacterized protein CCM_08894 [Cordyceps militaris CM01]EGX88848.1 hypothetical protein CCM_08894 [Cordyceps militaris CM01]
MSCISRQALRAIVPTRPTISLVSSRFLTTTRSNANTNTRGSKQSDSDRAVHANTTGSRASPKGATGGGAPLASTAPGAPNRPKVFSSDMPSDGGPNKLSKEQIKEVDDHNAAFEKTSEEPAQKADDGAEKTTKQRR